MKWFDKWFYKKAKWAWDNKDEMESNLVGAKVRKQNMSGMQLAVEESTGWEDGLRINVKKVIGGFIVSFRNYDRKTDRHGERHYIITDDQEFEKELGKFITLESMRQTS
jgi:hypothetical protein